ncbi:MAG: nucleoside monophosphate kinase, partial [Paludibacter sp.]|nr:nucleoside monophosphate kinase [Paludibacter sp.]
VAQAEALEKMLEKRDRKIDFLLDLTVDEAELVERLLKRGETSGRSDDNFETVKKRLEVYHNQTHPVTEFYKHLGKHSAVHGMGTPEEIFDRIENVIKDN